MILKKIKKRTAFALFALLLTSVVFSDEIDIKANTLDYDDENRFVVARGSVTITWEKNVLYAEEVKYDITKEFIVANGRAALVSENNVLSGKNIVYDLKTKKGEISETSGFFTPWYFHAGKVESRGAVEQKPASEARSEITGGQFTTCDLSTPHYFIRSNRAVIIPGKRILIYNPILFVRNIPVFYFPVFTQGLGPHRDDIEVLPGYNSEDGFTLKTIYTHPFTSFSHIRLYIDYYARRGIGKGAEYDYSLPGKLKGTFYGYQIKENITGHERWTMRTAYWQKLNPLWTGQAEANFLSDTTFNNSYFQENWRRVDQELRSNLSFTRQSSKNNLRFTTERTDIYNPSSGLFEPNVITLPRVEYTRFPFKNPLGLPVFANMSLALQNQYTRSQDFYLLSGSMDSSINRDYRLMRNLTLVPRLGFSESWQNRTSSTDPGALFTTRYYSDLNLRYRPSFWMDWDTRYGYRLRSTVNRFSQETEASDYGIERNDISFQNSIFTSRVIVRNSTSYDFRIARNESIADWRQKLGPLVNELIWTPSFYASVYLREESSLYPDYLRSVQSVIGLGAPEKNYANIGIFYLTSRPEQVDFNVGFGFWPTKKWRIDYIVRGSSLENFNSFLFNDHELKLYRDLHCWETKLTYRRRGVYEEIYFQIDLKTTLGRRQKQRLINQEKEFYPWRQ